MFCRKSMALPGDRHIAESATPLADRKLLAGTGKVVLILEKTLPLSTTLLSMFIVVHFLQRTARHSAGAVNRYYDRFLSDLSIHRSSTHVSVGAGQSAMRTAMAPGSDPPEHAPGSTCRRVHPSRRDP